MGLFVAGLYLAFNASFLSSSQGVTSGGLEGSWLARFTLDSAWRLPTSPRAKSLGGTLRLQAAARAPAGPAASTPVSPGRSAISFAPFGFRLGTNEVLAWRLSRDSVRLVLDPTVDHGHMMLDGVQDGDSIRGHWTLVGDPSGARGAFVLRREAPSTIHAHGRPEPTRDRPLRAILSLSPVDTTPSAQEGAVRRRRPQVVSQMRRKRFVHRCLSAWLRRDSRAGGSQNAGLVPSFLRDDVRVCVYDRANVGRSGSLPGPLTGKASVEDLHRLLAAAHIPGPYVLVGGSFGGLIAVMYAATYPEDVAGMVLLDASLPDDVIKIDNRFLPRDARYTLDAWKRNTEQLDRGATYRQAHAMQGRVPNIPLTYIGTTRIKLDPSWPVEQMTAAIRAEQRAFVTRFSRGRLILLDVPHFMEPVIPGTIAEEIKRVIAAAKSK